MSSATESTLRRDSAEFTYMPSNGGFDMSGSGGGPFTVFFRLVSSDNSPGHRLQPMTPLHTPFTQSPVHSPMQPSVPGGPMMSSGDRGALLYPHPSPPMGPMGSPSLPGVYYTTAPRPPPPGAGGYYGPGTGGLHFANIEQDPGMVKARAMSADIHHSPPFHYVPPQPHRSSFCLPHESGADLALVSEEMLLSAMPDRYDD